MSKPRLYTPTELRAYAAGKRRNRHDRKRSAARFTNAALSPAQIRRMVAGSAAVPSASWLRAMGRADLQPPHRNPRLGKRRPRALLQASARRMRVLARRGIDHMADPRMDAWGAAYSRAADHYGAPPPRQRVRYEKDPFHDIAGRPYMYPRPAKRTKKNPRGGSTMAARRRKRRTPPRNARGRFVKRSVSSARPARRRTPRRRKRPMNLARYTQAGGRRRWNARAARGRYRTVRSLYPASYTKRARRHNRKRSAKHYYAVKTIPSRAMASGLIRLNPRTGEMIMPTAIVANPRRRRRRRHHAAAAPRRHQRRRTRRNPRRAIGNPSFSMSGIVATLKNTAMPMAAGGAGGFVAGFIDAKFTGTKPLISMLTKIGLGVGGAILLKKKPQLALGFAGGVMGSLGYSMGIKLGGGMVAPTPGTALKGIADMASDDPELAAMLSDAEDLEDLVIAGDIADGEYEFNDMGELVEDDAE